MAEIILEKIAHSYAPNPQDENDWALAEIDLIWEDGGSYALLGPSGCGKSTLLNIISGLLSPTKGRIFFAGKEMSKLSVERRNIAQVFQFPVVYDTMTVYENLSFPLRNRNSDENEVKARVYEIAEMLDLDKMLQYRAKDLTPDEKQKISLGRGLVRADVNVVMLDEPLTMIDPHLKWQLRSQLKQLHKRYRFTMIYVTHDQTEALTLAEQIVVLQHGKVVQTGAPEELFACPQHTFVGHFIGSPGMNLFPATVKNNVVYVGKQAVQVDSNVSTINTAGKLEIGVRPEHISFTVDAEKGFSVTVRKVNEVGYYFIVEVEWQNSPCKIYLREEDAMLNKIKTNDTARVIFDPTYTHLYCGGWLHEATL